MTMTAVKTSETRDRVLWLPRLVLLGACLGSVGAARGEPGLVPASYAQAWRRGEANEYRAPSAEELSRTRAAFERLFRGDLDGPAASELQSMGWSVRTENAQGRRWTVVAEAEGQRRGRGLYAFSDRGRHALQAPHVPSDGLTGDILLRYAEGEGPRALAWNTLPRTQVDLAHVARSHFSEFSQAFAAAHPDELIVQVHGFDAGQRHSRAGAQSAAIVSSGTRRPSAGLQSAVTCLKERFDPLTRLYGQDVDELGATTNSIARALRERGFGGFVHLELDLPLRKALVQDAPRRRSLFDCLSLAQAARRTAGQPQEEASASTLDKSGRAGPP